MCFLCRVLSHLFYKKVRVISQNKKAAVEDLEATLKGLKKDLMLAFSRQEIIETRIEARERVDKKEPKEHLRSKTARNCSNMF